MPVEASFGVVNTARESNGRRAKAVPEEARIQGSLEGFVAAALTVSMPPLFYLIAYRHVIMQGEHLWGLLLLTSAPLLLLALLEVSGPISLTVCHDHAMAGIILHSHSWKQNMFPDMPVLSSPCTAHVLPSMHTPPACSKCSMLMR